MLTNWIDNRAVKTADADRLPVVDPATAEPVDEMPRGDQADVALAVAAASGATSAWAAMAPAARRGLLVEAAHRMTAARDDIAGLLTHENGKPRREAVAEVEAAIAVTHSYAELAVHLRSGSQTTGTGELNFQYRQPRGVAGVIVPWNFPIAVGTENVVPNLAVGNTVVFKPSEKTPMASRRMIEVAFGHLPDGVVNVVLGDGPSAGEHLIGHPDVDVVTFVGSERTGRHIAAVCGRDLRACVVELGGKDPFLVDDSADLDVALDRAVAAKYTASGQICTSPERFLVSDKAVDEFVERFVKRSEALRLGRGGDEATDMGPLIDDRQRRRVADHVDAAVDGGATVHCGGRPAD